jgi:hypothetical protein
MRCVGTGLEDVSRTNQSCVFLHRVLRLDDEDEEEKEDEEDDVVYFGRHIYMDFHRSRATIHHDGQNSILSSFLNNERLYVHDMIEMIYIITAIVSPIVLMIFLADIDVSI